MAQQRKNSDNVTELTKKEPTPMTVDEQLMALVKGTFPAPNDTVAFLVDRMKDCRGEAVALENNISRAEQQVAQMRVRLTGLRAQHDGYVDDIKHWLEKGQKGEEDVGGNQSEAE